MRCVVMCHTDGQKEEELGQVLKGVLVSSLDAVKDGGVLTVHLRILYTVLLAGLQINMFQS